MLEGLLENVGGGGGTATATWQSVTASTAGAASVDMSSDGYVYVDGDASFNLTIVDTADIVSGFNHIIVIENTSVGQITVTNGLTSITNLSSPITLDTGEWLRLNVFEDNQTNIHVVGGIGE